jgi:hypothetical protein
MYMLIVGVSASRLASAADPAQGQSALCGGECAHVS